MSNLRPAYAYLRVSGLGQVAGDGFPRQRLAVEEFSALNGYEIVKWYEEEGVSGKTDHDERLAMRQMLAEIGETKTVIVERLDRLARDLIIQEGIIAKFRESGVELLSTAEDNLCSEDPTRVFIRQVLGAVAQLDRSLIVKKLRAARDRKRANGRCEGRKPYGHTPEELAVLSIMRQWSRDGCSAEMIADNLNSGSGFETRSGKPWRASVIRKILARSSKKVEESPSR